MVIKWTCNWIFWSQFEAGNQLFSVPNLSKRSKPIKRDQKEIKINQKRSKSDRKVIERDRYKKWFFQSFNWLFRSFNLLFLIFWLTSINLYIEKRLKTINFNWNYIKIAIVDTILSLESKLDRNWRSNSNGLKSEWLMIQFVGLLIALKQIQPPWLGPNYI